MDFLISFFNKIFGLCFWLLILICCGGFLYFILYGMKKIINSIFELIRDIREENYHYCELFGVDLFMSIMGFIFLFLIGVGFIIFLLAVAKYKFNL